MKENYDDLFLNELNKIKSLGRRPGILLHACCAPCASYVLECLAPYTDITLLFANPNLYPASEYKRRRDEVPRLLAAMGLTQDVRFIAPSYEPKPFYAAIKGTEGEPEGGIRCERCYELRLRQTAAAAVAGGYDYFGTTLTISPHKPAPVINKIGNALSEEYGVKYLPSDFKKRDGFKRAGELCRLHGIYRQNYCGCEFSLKEGPL